MYFLYFDFIFMFYFSCLPPFPPPFFFVFSCFSSYVILRAQTLGLIVPLIYTPPHHAPPSRPTTIQRPPPSPPPQHATVHTHTHTQSKQASGFLNARVGRLVCGRSICLNWFVLLGLALHTCTVISFLFDICSCECVCV